MDYRKLLNEEQLIELSLLDGQMHYLLVEKVSEEDVAKMDAALSDARTKLKDIVGKMAQYKLELPGDLGSYAGKLSDATNKAAKTITDIDLEDKTFAGSDIAGVMRAVTAIQSKATEFHNALAGAVAAIQAVVSRFEYSDEQKAMKIEDLFGTASFPPTEALIQTIEKKLKDPNAWMSKIPGAGIAKAMMKMFQRGSGKEDEIMADIGDLPDFVPMAGVINVMTPDDIAKLGAEAEAAASDPPEVPEDAPDIIDDDTGGAPAGDGGDGDGAPPATDDEADTEQADTEEALRRAAEEAAANVTSPLDAALDAIQGWHDGLSKSSQQVLKAKQRLDGLKGGVKGALEDAADTVASQVRDAVAAWRGEHEETLMKSRRFAKKNFDSLEELIPQLAAGMMKQVSESHGRLSSIVIRRSVFKFLNKRFANELRGDMLDSRSVKNKSRYRLTEMLRDPNTSTDQTVHIKESDPIARWVELAGLKND